MTTFSIEELDAQMAKISALKLHVIEQDKIDTAQLVTDTLNDYMPNETVQLITKYLNQIGASFEIKTADGVVYLSKLSSRHTVRKNKKGPLADYKRGEVAAYVQKQLDAVNLKVGDECVINNDKNYDFTALKQATSHRSYDRFGKGGYATRVVNGCMVVERLA